jgi:hypothetical protein
MGSRGEFLLKNAIFARNIGIGFAIAVWLLHSYLSYRCISWPFSYETYASCAHTQLDQFSLLFLGANAATFICFAFAALIGIVGGFLIFLARMLNKQ